MKNPAMEKIPPAIVEMYSESRLNPSMKSAKIGSAIRTESCVSDKRVRRNDAQTVVIPHEPEVVRAPYSVAPADGPCSAR